ncbi:glycoside hydrolase family 2 protein [Mucilaginibacter sp. AW1-3]
MIRFLRLILFSAALLPALNASAQREIITNIPSRNTLNLNGRWQYIIDPYETGFYDYRYQERKESDAEAYWSSDVQANKMDRKEHGYIDKYTLNVPSDWNSQNDRLYYYEGTVWYKRSFDYKKTAISNQLYIYFGAVNYRADVYLNGKKLGMHKGGFTPFNFLIPDSVLKAKDNYLVVKVDNKRYADEIPTLNTDWWNYGGITRDVKLVELPTSAITDYQIQLSPTSPDNEVSGWVRLTNTGDNEKVTVEIPELNVKQTFAANNNLVQVQFKLPQVQLWSPENPKCYRVIVRTKYDKVEEKIGFRKVKVEGKRILVNGEAIFLRGISIHGEIPQGKRRAHSQDDAVQLLTWARELGCNMVRLAHYPHDEKMTRLADSLGLFVWSEIPVYWTIDFSSPAVLAKAQAQLHEMISRDHNRASIIIWSVGNETPVSDSRTNFMKTLLQTAKNTDPTRLVSAALEVDYHSAENMRSVDDPLGEYVDVVAFNEYLGWYGGTPESCRDARWATKYNKPLFISETGAEALGGNHGDEGTLWTEEFQERFYREQVSMLKRMPENYIGISPWILADFRSPRRNNPVYQEGWNNKGLIDHDGHKKKAFYILKNYYTELQKKD